jgi:S1-C subfamily serine protease
MKNLLLPLALIATLALAGTKASLARPPNQGLRYTRYKLTDGTVVNLSESQKAIANGLWRRFSPSELYRNRSGIVVTVLCDLGNDQGGQGTGFIINEDTIITNWHVVRNAKSISIVTRDGTRYENGFITGFNHSVDVACVAFVGMKSKVYGWLDTDSNWEQIGEPVYVIGSPQGLEQTLTSGLLSGWRANGALFQLTAPVTHGSSGSPVFNDYGMVIGIISRGLSDDGGELNIAISMNAIIEALRISNKDHPSGFYTGVTNGLELRSRAEIAEDNPPPRWYPKALHDHIDVRPIIPAPGPISSQGLQTLSDTR